jgi:hypothetical protein
MTTTLSPNTSIDYWAIVFSSSTAGPVNTVTEIHTLSDLTQFGTGVLTTSCQVLLRYGAKALAVRYDGTPDFSLLSAVPSDKQPIVAILPGSIDHAEAFISACVGSNILGIVDFIGNTADLINARTSDGPFGTKSIYLGITFPAVTNGLTVEYLSTHLGGLICQSVQLDYPINGQPIKSVNGVTVAVTPELQSTLVGKGVVTVNWPEFILYGFANSTFTGEITHDTPIKRAVIEQLIRKDISQFLNSRVGTPISLATARSFASELNVYLASRNDISGGYVTLDEAASTFTDTTAHLAYSVNVSLLTGTTLTFELTYD